VEKQYVHYDGYQQRQAKRNESADQEDQSARDLKGADGLHITGLGHGARKISSGALHRRHVEELEKDVKPKDHEHQAEKNANDKGCCFHTV